MSEDFYWEMRIRAAQQECANAQDMGRPFYLLRPKLLPDGDAWVAMYGDNLQESVTGVGDSPDAAARDFDRAWYAKAGVK